ncbi:4-alpha-glucanotransferase [Pseudoclavibacter chungangensis]|uniref:4-alpha-glucanotransferase n=1 Tax=Pseudoclavibacter chungangensis TaxID=587635 RepID=A0A7J5BME8_9MICO|nr:4-alpha-glucanotransferase [Pseudoclavibacter chungangensis]
MSPTSESLAELARRNGVGTEYWDWTGTHVEVPASTLVAVLAALDIDASDDEAVARALVETDERAWRRVLPPTVVARAGRPLAVPVHVPHGSPVDLAIVLEDGTTREPSQLDRWIDPREIDGALVGRATFELPGDLPTGWHRLRAEIPGVGTSEAVLVVTPERLTTATWLDEQPVWGLVAQAYQARSADSWGIGDAADIATLAEWSAARGAAFVLVNPLHAPAPVLPVEPSPYLPTTRRFVDPSMIRVDEVPGRSALDETAIARLDELGRAARALDLVDDIDRTAVWSVKREALALLFGADLVDPERTRAFGAFCEAEGEALVDFATYCALAEEHGRDWGAWPTGLHHPAAEAVARYRDDNADRVDFFRWLQWIVAEQLTRAQQRARDAGMGIGVVHDLAVGVHPVGADAWALPDSLARGVTVGAPPDQFNQMGQNWSQPPWRPDRLAELGYAPYRDMLRAVLRHAGGVRIDHILGLFRLWWIPEASTADTGAYVRYDDEALIGILALEAERAGAVVIGEDLGVVEERTRHVMAERGIDGTSILWFEWDADGRPLAPEEYRHDCLASVTTHDLPPTAGYLALEHVDIRERLGLLTRDPAEERAHERGVIAAVEARLRERGLLTTADPGVEDVVEAMHRYLASSRARLMGVSLADLAGDRRSVNQPGTYLEYPNWRVPLSGPDGGLLLLEELLRAPLAERIAAASVRH